MENIRTSLPLSQEIWRFSEMGMKPGGRDKDYDDLAAFESHVKEMLANGTYTFDQHVAPAWALPSKYLGALPV